MACILLTDMDPPTSSPPGQPNGLPPDLYPPTRLDPKQDMNVTCLTVHLYNLGKDGGEGEASGSERVLTFPPGEYIAEELCISAAKTCGESQEDFNYNVCPHTPKNIVSFQVEVYLSSSFHKHVFMLKCTSGTVYYKHT